MLRDDVSYEPVAILVLAFGRIFVLCCIYLLSEEYAAIGYHVAFVIILVGDGLPEFIFAAFFVQKEKLTLLQLPPAAIYIVVTAVIRRV